MNEKSARKLMEEKAGDIAASIEAELSTGVYAGMNEAIDMIFRSADRKAKITATVDLEYVGYNDRLKVSLSMKTEGKLQVKGDPFSFEVNLDGQQELPLDNEEDPIDVEGEQAKDGRAALPAAPKLLPGPGDVQEAEAEPVAAQEEGGKAEGKVKKITISCTSIFSSNCSPKQYPRLVSVRKAGYASEGEVVQIVMKNPDMPRNRFDMGLYRCVSAKPRDDYDREAGRCEYVFDRIEDEDGPVNGGGDLGDEED